MAGMKTTSPAVRRSSGPEMVPVLPFLVCRLAPLAMAGTMPWFRQGDCIRRLKPDWFRRSQDLAARKREPHRRRAEVQNDAAQARFAPWPPSADTTARHPPRLAHAAHQPSVPGGRRPMLLTVPGSCRQARVRASRTNSRDLRMAACLLQAACEAPPVTWPCP